MKSEIPRIKKGPTFCLAHRELRAFNGTHTALGAKAAFSVQADSSGQPVQVLDNAERPRSPKTARVHFVMFAGSAATCTMEEPRLILALCVVNTHAVTHEIGHYVFSK